jgi:hypothetical protein
VEEDNSTVAAIFLNEMILNAANHKLGAFFLAGSLIPKGNKGYN